MARRDFIVMIGDDGALVVPPEGKKDVAPLFVGHDEESGVLCARLFESFSHARARVVYDVRTQSLKREMVPPLSFFDRKKLVDRRLAQAFPDAPLRAALPFAAPHAWLFVALDETNVVSLWRDRLARMGVFSEGVVLAPLELARLLVRLEPKAKDGWGLLLLSHKTGGFRQIVTLNGKTVFTRITPRLPSTAHVETIASSLAEDVQATRLYLGRLGMATSAPWSFVSLLAPSVKDPFYAVIGAKEPSALVMTPYEAATRVGFSSFVRPDEQDADLVSALWMGRAGTKPILVMSAKERAERKTRRLARVGMLLAISALVVSFAYAANVGSSLAQLYERERALDIETVSIQREFTTLQKTAAETTKNLERLRAAIEKRRFFTRENASLEDIIPFAASAFEDAKARVTELTWKDGVLTMDVVVSEREEAAPTLTRAAHAEMQKKFDALAVALQKSLPRYIVKIDRYPFPNMPEETLTNKKDIATEPVARFAIVRRIS